ncbi:hypothetical protein M0802_013792 [Mischocyttarus mexicanus]|nr:hypothetical protein M0802_013792 [Mischocyttarus mexicanus]
MKYLWKTIGLLSVVFGLVNAWGINHAGQTGTNKKCERLTVSFCHGLRYNLTAMPNFMGHEDQLQAERGLATLMPLVHYNCSKHLRLFLCAVFAPVCSEHVAMQIPACKSLCLSVRRECEPALTSLTLPWPHMLDCDRFLDRGNTLCVQPPEETLSDAVPSVQQQWPTPEQIQPAQTSTGLQDHHNHHQCPPHFVETPDVQTISCVPRCGTDAYYRAEDKKFTERWIIGWAWLCFLSTLFTLLTFWVEPSRFRYPERPIVFLALCYNLLSLNYIIRGAIGTETLSCVSQLNGEPSYVPVHDGLKSIPCTCWWIIKHYLSLASSTWWTILCVCWFLSAKNEWSSEALHNIASRAIRSAGRSATKLERLMTRLGIFALLYVLPALGNLTCILQESSTKPRWRMLALLAALDCRSAENCSPGPVYSAAGLEVALLKPFLSLVIGVTSGMWVWSGKTCRAWSKLLAAPSKPNRTLPTAQPLTQNVLRNFKTDVNIIP